MSNTIFAKTASAVTTMVFAISVFVPTSFANTHLTIGGNGSRSNNSIDFMNSNSFSLNQQNNEHVNTAVASFVNSGGNESSGNTGGMDVIDTGNASSDITITTGGSSNIADIPCGCNLGNTTVNVSGNGSKSHSDVDVDMRNTARIDQNNMESVDTSVMSDVNTGNNIASNNTGNPFWSWWWNWLNNAINGGSSIATGNTMSSVDVQTLGSINSFN